jgi:hypothetical protein
MDSGAPQDYDYSDKIAQAVPSALLGLFAYTQHAWNRLHFKPFSRFTS